jgi:hypothetical protein
MRKRTVRRLAVVGGGEAPPPEDPRDVISRAVYGLHVALKRHMMGEMLRGRQRVKLVLADGSTEGEDDRQKELAMVGEAQEALRMAVVVEILDEPEFVELHRRATAPTTGVANDGGGSLADGVNPPGHDDP